MTRRSLPVAADLSPDTRQRALSLTDGRPIDYAVQPPPGCRGDLITTRPCPRTACRYHLFPQDERPGRPHSPGARPPVTLRRDGPSSCMWDAVNANRDGMTADEVGKEFHTVGERILQLENRGLLKMKAVDHVCAVLEEAMPSMPSGTEIEGVVVHNHVRDPHHHFVTVCVRVKEQTAKAGVRVRRRKV